MTVGVIIIGILAILLLGLAIYLWIDRKGWIETAKDAARTCGAIKEAYKDLDSFAKALDDENVELTVKCNQYEALLKTRLDDIPVADVYFSAEVAYPSCRGEQCRTCEIEYCPSNMYECNQEKCNSGECCETCAAEGCPDKKHAPTECFSIDCDECMVGDCIAESLMKQDSLKKPCCSCENGVYDPTECIGCTVANGYENYEPMKYE